MAIDSIKLRNGEPVTCRICNKGHMKPAFGKPPQESSCFICDNCGKRLILNFKMKKTDNEPSE